jgi:hypothetical protein
VPLASNTIYALVGAAMQTGGHKDKYKHTQTPKTKQKNSNPNRTNRPKAECTENVFGDFVFFLSHTCCHIFVFLCAVANAQALMILKKSAITC